MYRIFLKDHTSFYVSSTKYISLNLALFTQVVHCHITACMTGEQQTSMANAAINIPTNNVGNGLIQKCCQASVHSAGIQSMQSHWALVQW